MRFQRQTITVDEAWSRLMGALTTLGEEQVPIGEAYGRILARDILATCDMPPFDRSPLDGFAVRASDTAGATVDHPASLRVIETIPAGHIASLPVTEGCASRIMTGAMLPAGADAVIMFEQTENPGELSTIVKIKRAMKPGENISRRGEEIAQGTVVARAGERINAGTIALLATFGYVQAAVRRKPRIGLLSTGTELAGIEQPLGPGQIRNSNTAMLSAMIAEAGGIPVSFPHLADDMAKAKEKIAEHLKAVDLLVTTGGVSVGDFDVMASLADEPDVVLLFNRIAMRPGSPTTGLLFEGKPICALSGNPGACFLGFALFVRPALQRLSGQAHIGLTPIKARLAISYTKPCPYPRYLRGRLQEREATLYAYPDCNDKAGNLGTLKDSECFIIIPAGGSGKQAGELVDVIAHAAPNWRKEG